MFEDFDWKVSSKDTSAVLYYTVCAMLSGNVVLAGQIRMDVCKCATETVRNKFTL
jgi:hypothetical protein